MVCAVSVVLRVQRAKEPPHGSCHNAAAVSMPTTARDSRGAEPGFYPPGGKEESGSKKEREGMRERAEGLARLLESIHLRWKQVHALVVRRSPVCVRCALRSRSTAYPWVSYYFSSMGRSRVLHVLGLRRRRSRNGSRHGPFVLQAVQLLGADIRWEREET